MPVNVIGTLKPKNNGKFPVAEAVDIKVTGDLRLDEALENKADLSTVNFALDNKADKTTTTNLQSQIDEIITPVTQDAEVQNARVGADGKSYVSLKARIDAEVNNINRNVNNVYDASNLTADKATKTTDGTLIDAVGWAVTDYIPISYGDIVELAFLRGKSLSGGALYDSNFQFIKAIFGTYTWVKPSADIDGKFRFVVDSKEVAYIRYNVAPDATFSRANQYLYITPDVGYVNLYDNYESINNNAISSYGSMFDTAESLVAINSDLNNLRVNRSYMFSQDIRSSLINAPDNFARSFTVITYNCKYNQNSGVCQIAVSLVGEGIAVRYYTNAWTPWVHYKTNYKSTLNKSTLIENKIITTNDGSVADAEGYAITDYIPISYGDLVELAYVRGKSLSGGALYDSNHQFIKSIFGTSDWVKPDADVNSAFSFIVDSKAVAYIRYNVVTESLFSRKNQYLNVTTIKGYEPLKRSYTVGIHGDFTTLKGVTEYISNNNIWDATVYIEPGTYDLVTEYGTEYLDSIVAESNIGFGLHIGYNTHYIFSYGSKVEFNYDGDNPDCAEYFSPFNITGSCILENLNCEVTNARYCVHEDLPTSADTIPDSYTIKYIDCNMKHNGATVETGHHGFACIGAGTNKNSTSVIDGGYYNGNWTADISYHNYDGNAPSKIVIRDVYMAHGLRLADFGTSVVDVSINSCFMPALNGTHTYFTVRSWNNVSE